jgi:hypothetical protein
MNVASRPAALQFVLWLFFDLNQYANTFLLYFLMICMKVTRRLYSIPLRVLLPPAHSTAFCQSMNTMTAKDPLWAAVVSKNKEETS